LLIAALCWMLAALTAVGAPPRVVKAVPDNGDTDVDPNLSEIRVTFDQDMQQGSFSWVGGGPTFPKLRGKPLWIDARTCVLRVRLEPNHQYWVSINSNRFTGFRNKQGEPAVPYPMAFRTRSAKPGEAQKLTPAAAHKDAVDELQRAIKEEYSYRDLRGVDWEKLFREHRPKMEQSKSAAGFAREAAKLLAHAKDVHIWLMVGNQPIGTFQRNVTPNYSRATLARVVPNWKRVNSFVYVGRFDDGIGYILIRTWVQEQRDALEAAFKALDGFLGAKRLIVDVRPNSGGAEMLARRFAGRFVDKPVVYAMHVTRSIHQPGGFTKPHKRVLQPVKGRPTFRGRLAVLMGPVNLSSCEAFLLMMKRVPGCKLIGERSYGSSGNPQAINLGNAVTVYLPSWKAMDAEGRSLEGKGISPDITVKATQEEFEKGDPVLEAALKFLRKP